MPQAEWTILARLVRPHGRRGEIVAELLTDFPERFAERRRLFLIPPQDLHSRPREIDLQNHWLFKGRIVFKFAGIESINDAEAIRGYEVAIPKTERAALEEGAVYISDLIGCHLINLNQQGIDVGEIIDVDTDSSNTMLLVVRRPGRRANQPASEMDVFVPFVKAYLEQVDTKNKRVEMRLPEGLLDINAPMTEEERRTMQREPEDK